MSQRRILGLILAALGITASSAHAQVSELPTTAIGPEVDEYAPDTQGPQPTMFGYAVATAGTVAFATMPAQDGGKGRVAIFAAGANNTWQREGTLLPPEGETSFGNSIAYAHGVVVVTAASGAYVYRGANNDWPLLKKIDAPPAVTFGALAHDAHTLAITAAPLGKLSTVDLFEGADFQGPTAITAEDVTVDDAFGYEVAVAGHTLVIGAPFQQNARGAVYIFRKQKNGWVQSQKLVASEGGANFYFGASVAIDDKRIVVGAPGVPNPNTPAGHKLANQGAVYVFTQQGDTFVREQTLQPTDEPGEYLNFGTQVRIRGDKIAVTSPVGSTRFQPATCLVYAWDGAQWAPRSFLFGEYTTGTSLSLSKRAAILGGPIDSAGGFDIGHGLIAPFSDHP